MKRRQNNSEGSFALRAAFTLIALCAIVSAPRDLTGQTPTPSCANDNWTATSFTNAPNARAGHTAVWTGGEMIVWGGQGYGQSGVTIYLNTGGRYDPGTDSWTATSTTNAPSARIGHSAVWTGSEMIVWGGPTVPPPPGGRYNPATDSWTPTGTTNAPTDRYGHGAIWTGSEMIVWGGVSNGPGGNVTYENTGGRYNPGTDSWASTSTTNAPTGRNSHVTVWTGSEMIVWGGTNNTTFMTNTGGRYNPATDSWSATSTVNAPDARVAHTAVWTGTEMIVWGGMLNSGAYQDTGRRYNPITDSWTATSTTNAPTARGYHRAVWTGSEMIVWGGNEVGGTLSNTGARYNPNTDSWTPVSTTDAPLARGVPSTVWTGTQMVLWGGSQSDVPGRMASIPDLLNYVNSGGRYCVQSAAPPGSPTPVPSTPTPTPGTPTPTPGVTPTPGITPTPTPSPSPISKAINLSTRLRVLTGDRVGIGGFIISGPTPKRVLLRGIGPSLKQFGIASPLPDPILEMRRPDGSVAVTNDNWRDDQEAEIQATGLQPTDDLESAIVATLNAGAYTVILRGSRNTIGIALIEAYDLNQGVDSKLANISTRGLVNPTDNNIVIAGFVLSADGVGADSLIVRGIGPSLAAIGISPVLADPTLELRDNNGALLLSNNDWQENPEQAMEIDAAGLAPTNGLESAMAATLPPGLYTALLAGRNNGTGIGVIEVYDRGP